MASMSIAEAKDRFPELVRRAEAGEPVIITRRGKAVVEVKACSDAGMTPEEKETFLEHMRDELARMAPASMSAVELIRAIRDED